MATQMTLTAVCGDIASLRCCDNSDNQCDTDGGCNGTRDGYVHGESYFRTDDSTDNTDDDTASKHGFHRVRP